MGIRIAHPGVTPRKVWILRSVLLLVMCVLPAFTMLINNGIIFGVYFVCIQLQLALDLEGKEKREEIRKDLKEKRASGKDGAENSETSASTTPFKHFKTQKSGVGGF